MTNAESMTVKTKGEEEEKWDDISDADLLQSTQLVEEAAAQAAEKFNLSQGVKDVGPSPSESTCLQEVQGEAEAKQLRHDGHHVSNEEFRLRKLNAIPESEWEYKKTGVTQASEGNTEGPEQEGTNPVSEDQPVAEQAPPGSVTEEEINVTDCSQATPATPSKIEQSISQGAEKGGGRKFPVK